MSRTPEFNIDKLPKWVQHRFATREVVINQLMLTIEELEDTIKQLEETNEELAKRGEENAVTAIDDLNLREYSRQQFENRLVDL